MVHASASSLRSLPGLSESLTSSRALQRLGTGSDVDLGPIRGAHIHQELVPEMLYPGPDFVCHFCYYQLGLLCIATARCGILYLSFIHCTRSMFDLRVLARLAALGGLLAYCFSIGFHLLNRFLAIYRGN
jgi:hypothetical protein